MGGGGPVATIDERMRAALARLNDNEKQCLRRRLRHQTAKEMALELGVSPHAVEKRLKMARTKLGLSSSLEAARLLAASEEYQRTGPQAADLAAADGNGKTWPSRPLILGAATMTLLATLALAYAAQIGTAAPDPSPTAAASAAATQPSSANDEPRYMTASASPAQVEAYIKDMFARFDRDGSGFIERAESPAKITLGCCGSPARDTAGEDIALTGEAAWRRFLSDSADDGDDRVSLAEYRDARFERLLENGIPVRREDVALVGERPSPYAERQPGTAPVRIQSEDLQHVPASPERVRAYVRTMFDAMDRDKSDFVELAEAPASLITQMARLGPDGKATYDPNDPARELRGDEARRQYVANVDQDGDGKISFEEYAEPVMPQFLRRGIPLIPADWTRAPPERTRGLDSSVR